MNFLTRFLMALWTSCIPAVASLLIWVCGAIYSLCTMTIGGGEMGPGLTLPFIAIGILLIACIVWFISFIILLCAGFSWQLLWWITGITAALSLGAYMLLHLA